MNAIIEFLKELIKRIKEDSPKTFITIRWGSFVIMLISGAAYFGSQMGAFTLNESLLTVADWLLKVLAGVWGLSFLPVKEPDKLQKADDEK